MKGPQTRLSRAVLRVFNKQRRVRQPLRHGGLAADDPRCRVRARGSQRRSVPSRCSRRQARDQPAHRSRRGQAGGKPGLDALVSRPRLEHALGAKRRDRLVDSARLVGPDRLAERRPTPRRRPRRTVDDPAAEPSVRGRNAGSGPRARWPGSPPGGGRSPPRTGTRRPPASRTAVAPAGTGVAPRSMSACVQAPGRSGGTAASASACSSRPGRSGPPAAIRPRTRRTLVSTAPTGPGTRSPRPRAPCTARRPAAPGAPRVRRDLAAVVARRSPAPLAGGSAPAGCSPGPATRAARPRRAPRRGRGPSGNAPSTPSMPRPPGPPGSAAPSAPTRGRRTGRRSTEREQAAVRRTSRGWRRARQPGRRRGRGHGRRYAHLTIGAWRCGSARRSGCTGRPGPSCATPCLAVEAAGFDTLWIDDHLLCDEGDSTDSKLEGWATLAALAAVTSRARLGLLVARQHLPQPWSTAKLAATLDHVCGGRADPGSRRRLVRARARRLRHRLRAVVRRAARPARRGGRPHPPPARRRARDPRGGSTLHDASAPRHPSRLASDPGSVAPGRRRRCRTRPPRRPVERVRAAGAARRRATRCCANRARRSVGTRARSSGRST